MPVLLWASFAGLAHDQPDWTLPEIVEEGLATPTPSILRETLRPEPGEGPVMTFDYELQEGLATGGNAMRLLELVGLDT